MLNGPEFKVERAYYTETHPAMTKSPPRLPFATTNASRFHGNMRHYHRASQQAASAATAPAHKRPRKEASSALKRAGLILGALAFAGILCAVAIALSA